MCSGDRKRSIGGLGLVGSPALSPDGAVVACVRLEQIPGNGNGVIRVRHHMILHSIATGVELLKFEVSNFNAVTHFSGDGRSLVCRHGNVAELWDLHGGGRRLSLTIPETTAMAFSPDGRFLAMASVGAPVFLWDLHASAGKVQPLDEAELPRAWEALASRDCKVAFDAIRRLAAEPTRSLPFLKARLAPVKGPDPDRLKTLFADLNHDQFRKRESASRELSDLGAMVHARVREELRRSTSAEHQARLEKLLTKTQQMTPQEFQEIRAVEIAEAIASADADQLLTHWSGGFAGAILTREANAALARRRDVVGK